MWSYKDHVTVMWSYWDHVSSDHKSSCDSHMILMGSCDSYWNVCVLVIWCQFFFYRSLCSATLTGKSFPKIMKTNSDLKLVSYSHRNQLNFTSCIVWILLCKVYGLHAWPVYASTLTLASVPGQSCPAFQYRLHVTATWAGKKPGTKPRGRSPGYSLSLVVDVWVPCCLLALHIVSTKEDHMHNRNVMYMKFCPRYLWQAWIGLYTTPNCCWINRLSLEPNKQAKHTVTVILPPPTGTQQWTSKNPDLLCFSSSVLRSVYWNANRRTKTWEAWERG